MYKIGKEIPRYIKYHFYVPDRCRDRKALDAFKKAIDGKNINITYSDLTNVKIRTFVANEEETPEGIATITIGYIPLGIIESGKLYKGMRRLIDDIVIEIQSGNP